MSKIPSLKLFDLIHALNKSEKRYFKVNATRHIIGEKNCYVELFDTIEKQKKYNEELILKKLSLSRKQLADSKNYLYKYLLTALRQFHASYSVEAELNEMLDHISILYEKGLIAQCWEIQKRIKKVAEKYDLQYYIFEAGKWNMKLKFFANRNTEEVNANIAESERIIERFANEINIRNAGLKIIQKQSAIINGSKREIASSSKIINNILQKKIPNSFAGKLYYYNTLGSYYRTIKKNKEAHLYRKKELELWEQNPHQKKTHPENYMSSIVNFFNILNQENKFYEAKTFIDKLIYEGKSRKIKSEYLAHELHMRLINSIATGDISQAIGTVRRVEKTLLSTDFITGNQNILQLYSKCSLACFLNGNLRESTKFINKFIHHPEARMAGNYTASKIFHLVLHYELGEVDFLTYSIKSAYKYLIKAQKLNLFESKILKFISSTIHIHSKKKMVEQFKLLRNDLIKLNRNPYERWAIENYRFIDWLDSKIEKKPMIEIIKNKLAGNEHEKATSTK